MAPRVRQALSPASRSGKWVQITTSDWTPNSPMKYLYESANVHEKVRVRSFSSAHIPIPQNANNLKQNLSQQSISGYCLAHYLLCCAEALVCSLVVRPSPGPTSVNYNGMATYRSLICNGMAIAFQGSISSYLTLQTELQLSLNSLMFLLYESSLM